MPATAAIDNETLDHLLSVVNDGNQYKAIFAIRKCLQRPSSRINRLVRHKMMSAGNDLLIERAMAGLADDDETWRRYA